MKMPEIHSHCIWAIDSQGRLWHINTLTHRAAPTLNIRHLPSNKQYALLDIVWQMWISQIKPYRRRMKPKPRNLFGRKLTKNNR